MHRHTSTPGNLFKAGDPRVLFADIDTSITNALRGLVADDRIELFRALLKTYVPDLEFSDFSDRTVGELRHDLHSHPFLMNLRGGR